MASALVGRTELPQPFCVEVRKKVIEMSCEDEEEGGGGGGGDEEG